MFKKESSFSFLLAVIGAVLVIVNGLWIASNGGPIVLTSYPAYSTNQVYANGSAFWGRVSLGVPGFADTAWLSVFLVFGVVSLLCGLLLLIRPKSNGLFGGIIIICSILSIPIGGGFILGAVLGLIGGVAGIEWPKPLQETFVGRFLRVLKLDSGLLKTASDEPKYLSQGVWTLILANAFSAFGYAIYNLTAQDINKSTQTAFNVLFLGQLTFDVSVFAFPLIYIGMAIFKWLILSLLIYLIGAKILGSRASFDSVATVAAFAYAPVALQIFLPVVFSNQLVLWAFAVFFFTNAWMILALLAGVRQALEISRGKAVGILLLGGGAYWIIDFLMITPLLDIPGIWFVIKPATIVLFLFSIGAIFATLTGIFAKQLKFE